MPPDSLPPPRVEVVIEIPRWSFLKRGSTGSVDFVSPLPCPYNYGSVPAYLGGDDDLLDALVLGPRLPRGTRTTVWVWGAVGFAERGMYDDKLICSREAPTPAQRRAVLGFFRCYAFCKSLLNICRGWPDGTTCKGWQPVAAALARAEPRRPDWPGPTVPF